MRSDKSGYTVVEVLISVAVASVLFSVILFLYLRGQQSFDANRTYLDVYADARLAADWMAKDIKGATQVLPVWGGYTTSGNSLVLEVPSIDASGDIVSSLYDHLIYQVNSATLERIVDAEIGSSRLDETKSVANNITALTFSSGGITLDGIGDLSTVDNIGLSLTAGRTSLGRTYQETLNSVIKLRNK